MSTFKFTSLLFASTLVLTGVAHAADTRGHIVAVSQGQVEIQLYANQVPREGTAYRVTPNRGGSPKDVANSLRLSAGHIRITMPIADGRAHARVLDGRPMSGDNIWEEN